ncbi:MAG: DUF2683 family protein [Methanobacteriota archaeon]
MVNMLVNLNEHRDRILKIVKGKYGFSNKSEAVNYVIDKFEEEFLEPELRPEYVEKIKRIEREKGIPFRSIEELRASIEHA